MEWTQTITLGATLIAYMTGMCIFLYRLNEKSIKEWRDEHKSQMNEWRDEHRSQMNEWRAEHKSHMEKSENHWHVMFQYMTDRLDKLVEKR